MRISDWSSDVCSSDLLGPDGLARSVVVAAPADVSPLLRLQGASYATRLAEHFRDQGLDVLLIMDSLTRYAMAQREIALAIGEPPATKGYPPSVFARLPALVERAGTGAPGPGGKAGRSEEHTSELQSLMRISYAVFCLKKKKKKKDR